MTGEPDAPVQRPVAAPVIPGVCLYRCEQPARLYPCGWRCPEHAPPAQPTPDPTRTLDALRARAGLTYAYRLSDSALVDDRAVASGKRRARPEAVREAQQRERARRGHRQDATAEPRDVSRNESTPHLSQTKNTRRVEVDNP